MLELTKECVPMKVSESTVELCSRTPSSIQTFAPIQTFGPIEQPCPIFALLSIKTGSINSDPIVNFFVIRFLKAIRMSQIKTHAYEVILGLAYIHPKTR